MKNKTVAPRRRRSSAARAPAGFTLVEMLVAVALVLLIMSLFAQIFQIAGSTITTQRGIAENDQKSRSLQNQLTADLDKRTFRLVMPWTRGELASLAETEAVSRKGYFYISENDPGDDTDDFLQFTTNVLVQTKNLDLTRLYGKAAAIPNAGNLRQYPNQPEYDDEWPASNGAAESSAAEVCYFLRGGKLYRRVLLLRQPSTSVDPPIAQPGFQDNSVASPVYRDFFDPALPFYAPAAIGNPPARVFWNDFDYSAFYFSVPPVVPHATFHSVDDLDNGSDQTQFPLGKPYRRFGHHPFPSAGTLRGRSREFDSANVYFGRFTHEETSHEDFRYPQTLANVGPGIIPMEDVPGAADDLILNTTRNVFPNFEGGPRRGEDLILSNVLAFDIKVWDRTANGGAGEFVDIGDLTLPANSTFALGNRLNTQYGPTTTPADNRVFDTWYPYPSVTAPTLPEYDLNTDGNNDQPPFSHRRFIPPAAAGVFNSTGGTKPVWAVGQNYNEGDIVFPNDVAPNNGQRNNGYRFYYRCVIGGSTTGNTPPTVQEWPSNAGARFAEPANVFNPNPPTWEAVDNWLPLSAVQITIRFLDITSNQIRQMTIVHSLTD